MTEPFKGYTPDQINGFLKYITDPKEFREKALLLIGFGQIMADVEAQLVENEHQEAVDQMLEMSGQRPVLLGS